MDRVVYILRGIEDLTVYDRTCTDVTYICPEC